MYKNNQLNAKRNGSHRVSSYTLNISLKEAKALGFSSRFFDTRFVVKEIVDDKLVISRAFPQDETDMLKILDSFHLAGKRLSKKMLLDLLYFIEGNSEAYQKQKNKVYDSIRYLGRNIISYKGQYAFFNFKIKMNKNRVIESYRDAAPTFYPDFE